MKSESWTLLWSKQQRCFHVEPLERTMESGMQFFKNDQTNDYLLLSVGSRDEVCDLAEKLRPLLMERETVRSLYEAE